MQCAEIVEAAKPLAVVQRPLASVAARGVLLRTLYAGVCHSDLHILDDATDLGGGKVFHNSDHLGDRYRGLVLGHEICGEVMALGDEVPNECDIKIGDTVIVFPWKGCGECEICKADLHNICINNLGGVHDIGTGGIPGGYSTHVPIPNWELAIKLPTTIPKEVGCMLPCSALTAYSALLKTKQAMGIGMKIKGEARLMVVGMGGLGFWVMSLRKLVFPEMNVRLMVADVSQAKLEAAKTVGADEVVLWGKDQTPEELINATTKGRTYLMDAVIDFVGMPSTVSTGLWSLQRGGTLVNIGFHGGAVPVSLPMLTSNAISIQGNRVGPIWLLRELVELVANQGVTPPPMEFVNLEQINETHDRMRKGLITARAIIKYDK